MMGMRSAMITVLDEDYITMAEAKGLSQRAVMFRYAMCTSSGSRKGAMWPRVPTFPAWSRRGGIVETVEIAQGLAEDRRVVLGARRPLAAGASRSCRRWSAGRGGSGRNRLMGRLSEFKYREVARRLRTFGWSYDRPVPAATRYGVTRAPAAM